MADVQTLGYQWEAIVKHAGDDAALATVKALIDTDSDANFWALAYEYLIASVEPVDAVAVAKPAPVAVDPISAGYYTIVMNGDDDYVTLKVEPHFDEQKAAKGDMMVSYLAGPDNSTDYVGFGFLTCGTFRVWNKFAGKLTRQQDAVKVLGNADKSEARLAYAMRSGRCARCGRRLTVPASLHRGLGPDCAGKM